MDTVTEEMLSEKLPRDMVNRILLYLSLSDILKKPDFRLTILDEEYMKFYASQRYKIKGDNILAKLMKHERLIHLLIPISLGIVPYFDENLEAYQLEELDPDHWAYKTADTRESVYEEGLYDEDSVGNDVINCKVLQEKYESPLKAMIKENKNVEDIIWLKFVRYYEFDEDEKDEDSDPDSPYISVLLKVHELPEELSDFGSQLAENNMYGLPPIGYKKPELNI